MSAHDQQQTSQAADTNLSADLLKAIDSTGGLISAYHQTWTARMDLAQKEWVLTKHAVSMVLVVTLVMSAVISSLWILVNVGLASALYQGGVAIWAISLVLMFINIGLLILLWKTLRHLLGNIGFSQLLTSLSNQKSQKEGECG
jgi:hypothetical protein